MLDKIKNKRESGVTILLTIVVVSLGFSIVLGLANIFLNELIISRSASDATAAFYAADAGVERALYLERKGGGLSPCTGTPCEGGSLTNGATFDYFVSDQAGVRRIKAVGSFRETNRALESFYPTP